MKKEKIINYSALREKLADYTRKAGRASAHPVLLMYQVMKNPGTPKKDKLLIFAALSYLLLPIDIIPAKRLPFLGWMDEIFSLSVVYQKVRKHVTPGNGIQGKPHAGQMVPAIHEIRRADDRIIKMDGDLKYTLQGTARGTVFEGERWIDELLSDLTEENARHQIAQRFEGRFSYGWLGMVYQTGRASWDEKYGLLSLFNKGCHYMYMSTTENNSGIRHGTITRGNA